jgi:hypothetical protein
VVYSEEMKITPFFAAVECVEVNVIASQTNVFGGCATLGHWSHSKNTEKTAQNPVVISIRRTLIPQVAVLSRA